MFCNVIISYYFKEFVKKQAYGCTEGCRHLIYVIATAIGWTIPRGPTEIAEHMAWRHSSWLTHSCSPRSMEFETILLHFLHKTDASMLRRLFDNCKYMYIYLPIHQEYAYLRKQNICLYFKYPASTCEHLWPSPCKDIDIPRGQLRIHIMSF